MRKKIIIGSLLAVFLMMMLPSAYAVESNAVKEKVLSRCPFTIPEIDIEELKAKYTDNPSEPTCILLSVLIWFLRLFRKFYVAFAFTAILVIFWIISRITNKTTCTIS